LVASHLYLTYFITPSSASGKVLNDQEDASYQGGTHAAPSTSKRVPIASQNHQKTTRRREGDPAYDYSYQGKQMEAKRKMSQLLNLKKYPYSRALHYYFDLD
jgi:hypothetical protein